MGLGTWLGFATRPDYLASPFSTSELEKVVLSDVLGTDYAPLGRSEAMAIPSLSKARDLLTDAVAGLPMLAYRGAERVPTQPSWLYRTEGAVSPYLRMAWTVDDLLFYGASVWEVERGAQDGDSPFRPILSAHRVPYNAWTINDEGEVLDRDNQPYGDRAIYIPHHTTGLLDRSAGALRSAAAIGKAVEARTKTPIPVMEIRVVGDSDADHDELKSLRDAYNKARLDPDGVTVVTPAGVQLVPHGDRADAGFMVEGRNAVRLDMGNITGVPGLLLEGSTATASLTYVTEEGKRSEFYAFSVSPFVNTIAGRLSQDDCLPRGQRVEFDLTDQGAVIPGPVSTRQD